MQRINPLLTLPGLLITLLLFLGLGAALWLHGGEAFSPGPLSAAASGRTLGGAASHAEIEHQCERCHQPLRSEQAPLCLECHTAVASELQNGAGAHGLVEAQQPCRICHPDHRGRDFSPALAAASFFNHDATRFSLARHALGYNAAPLGCSDCHSYVQPGGLEVATPACQDCHAAADPAFMQQHLADFAPAADCLACHDGLDSLADFQHPIDAGAAGEFVLGGQHVALRCGQCHLQPPDQAGFAAAGSDCIACHAEPQLHQGLFDPACEQCHTPQGWRPAQLQGRAFDHAVQGRFSLVLHSRDYAGSPLTCVSCHVDGQTQAAMQVCADCHAAADAEAAERHRVEYGLAEFSACLDCHDGVDRLSNFDHARFFLLDGRHLELECADCHHANPALPAVFKGLGNTCLTCHAEPEIHAGAFGVECQNCHTTSAWMPALLRSHRFPLDHGEEGQQQCSVCHPQNYVTYTCYGCHEHNPQEIEREHLEENVSLVELPACAKCHPDGREHEGDGGGD